MRTPAVALVAFALAAPTAAAQSSVTVAGDLQSEAGCPGDWAPDCDATSLRLGASDGIWRRALTLPAGSYAYKAALDGSWTVNYGARATQDGTQSPLRLAAAGPVRFYFDPVSHWITDSRNAVIATAAGSFQSELGCPADWAPDCLRSWLQDVDGDGRYTLTTTAIPVGRYETKVALDEAWDVSYGRDGQNVPFAVERAGEPIEIAFDSTTHAVTAGPPVVTPQPTVTPTPSPTPTPTPTTPTGVPTPAPAATDTTAPVVRIARAGRRRDWLRPAGARVAFTVSEPSRIAWRLRYADGTVAGRGTFRLAAGRRTRALTLSRPARRRLARRPAARLTLVVRATDAAGNRRTTRAAVRRTGR